VAFTSVEEERMARCLGMDTAGFRARYTWRKYGILSLREIENYDCVFLRREGTRARCKIYPVRPAQCRAFPFWPEVMKNERTWNSYSLSCPGMNGGVLHSIAEINGYIGQ
jgi:Fe-S-cluster containining protein